MSGFHHPAHHIEAGSKTLAVLKVTLKEKNKDNRIIYIDACIAVTSKEAITQHLFEAITLDVENYSFIPDDIFDDIDRSQSQSVILEQCFLRIKELKHVDEFKVLFHPAIVKLADSILPARCKL